MITGAQIRESRRLLGWSRQTLTFKCSGLRLAEVVRAEAVDGQPAISEARAAHLQRALEAAGVEFTNGEQPGVRLRARD